MSYFEKKMRNTWTGKPLYSHIHIHNDDTALS